MQSAPNEAIVLSDGEPLPVLGQGTWRMGKNALAHKNEGAALRLGIELDWEFPAPKSKKPLPML
jgi:hypothetical protein